MYRILFFSGVLFGSVFSFTVDKSATNQTLLNTTVITNTNASIVQSENKIAIEPVNQVSAPPSNGREGVVSHSALPEVSVNKTTTTTTEIPIPMVKPINTTTITLNETAIKNVSVTVAPSKISARKGVTLPESLKTGPVTVVKKPTITENAEDDYKQPDTKSIKNNMNVLVPDSKEHKRAAYLIPIIAVIFSVPLVAAIISVLYKRGSEWWQHRHYRRMDFLIEGMYNN